MPAHFVNMRPNTRATQGKEAPTESTKGPDTLRALKPWPTQAAMALSIRSTQANHTPPILPKHQDWMNNRWHRTQGPQGTDGLAKHCKPNTQDSTQKSATI